MPSSARRVAIIGTVGVPARYGGFETLAEQLVLQLGEQFEFTVYCSRRAYPEAPPEFAGAKLRYLPLDANGAQSVPYDVLSIVHALVRRNDALLILGVSGALVLPALRRLGLSGARLIVHMDGLEWQREKWGPAARRLLRASERAAVRSAGAVIADNTAIGEYVRKTYGVTPRVIEYGADHVRPADRDEELLRELGLRPGEYGFSVCRIEPENNIHVLLEGFRQAASLPLVVVGNWERSRYGRDLRTKCRGDARMILLDPIYDARKLNALRGDCGLYLHGHSAGGTNPSLLEAMQLERPVAAFDVVYNRVTTEDRALFFRTAAELATLVRRVTPRELGETGAALKEIVRRRYTWSRIAQAYAALLEGRAPCRATR